MFATVGQGWNVQTNQLSGGAVRLRDAATGELIRTFADGSETFCDASFSPDGTQLATISLHDSTRSLTGWVRVWDVSSGELLRSRQLTDDYPMKQLSRVAPIKKILPQIQFGSKGKVLVTSAPVIAFDAETLEPKWQVENSTRSFVISHGVLVRAGRLKLLHLETGEEKGMDRGNVAIDLSEHPDRNQLLHVAGGGNQIAFFRAKENGLSQTQKIAIPKSFWTTFTTDGKHIVRSELSGDVVVQTPVKDGDEADRLVGHQSPVVSGAFNRSGKRLITADRSGVIKIWNVGSSRNEMTFDIPNMHGEAVESIAFDPSHRLHYAGSNFYEKRRPKVAGRVRSDGSGRETFEIETTRHIFWPRHDITYSPDGRMVAAPAKEDAERPADQRELIGFSDSDRIHIWSTETNEIQRTIELHHPGWITAVAWRHDAKTLAVGAVSSNGSPQIAFVPLEEADAIDSLAYCRAGDRDVPRVHSGWPSRRRVVRRRNCGTGSDC